LDVAAFYSAWCRGYSASTVVPRPLGLSIYMVVYNRITDDYNYLPVLLDYAMEINEASRCLRNDKLCAGTFQRSQK